MVIALGDDQLFTLLFLIQKALYDVPNVGPFNTYLGTKTNRNSVTRFGEISPLWQIFDCSLLIWQNAEPTLANL